MDTRGIGSQVGGWRLGPLRLWQPCLFDHRCRVERCSIGSSPVSAVTGGSRVEMSSDEEGVDVKRAAILLAALTLALAACGGGDSGGNGSGDVGTNDAASSEENSSDGGGSGDVVDAQQPGQAMVSVEGREYTLEVSPAIDCSISDDSITFAFWVGDNSVVLGGGANLYDDGWLGSIELRISEPEGEDGPISYFPDQGALDDGIAISGDSMSYSGPLMKQPANDGSNPPPVDVGDGMMSATCG